MTESSILPSRCRVNSGQSDLHNVPCDQPTAHVELTRVDSTCLARISSYSNMSTWLYLLYLRRHVDVKTSLALGPTILANSAKVYSRILHKYWNDDEAAPANDGSRM